MSFPMGNAQTCELHDNGLRAALGDVHFEEYIAVDSAVETCPRSVFFCGREQRRRSTRTHLKSAELTLRSKILQAEAEGNYLFFFFFINSELSNQLKCAFLFFVVNWKFVNFEVFRGPCQLRINGSQLYCIYSLLGKC